METTNGEPQALLFAQHFATLPDRLTNVVFAYEVGWFLHG